MQRILHLEICAIFFFNMMMGIWKNTFIINKQDPKAFTFNKQNLSVIMAELFALHAHYIKYRWP